MSSVAVIGDGAWGTALAMILDGNGHQVAVWSPFPEYADEVTSNRENRKYLPGIPVPESITFTGDTEAVRNQEAVVSAVPTKFISAVFGRFTGDILSGIDILSVAKGIDHDVLKRPTELISSITGSDRLCALSGPSHAEEVVRGLPTAVVVAGAQAGAAKFQALLSNELFRVYTSTDLAGVELGGALKNVIAIAAGICDGIGLGDNAKSALMTRGLEEMRRLGEALGAERATFFGLSGMGDLITTCVSPFGRNRSVGERLGRGEGLEDILESMTAVAEGVLTTKSVCSLAEQHGLDMPISAEVYQVAFEKKDARQAVKDLMLRDLKYEF